MNPAALSSTKIQALSEKNALPGKDEAGQYLTFTLGAEIFAVDILGIKEILRYTPPTEVPMTHPCLAGVINLRGRVVPVIDLAVRLGRPAITLGRRTCIVIAEIADDEATHLEIGLVIDAVRAVGEIPTRIIESPPAFGVRIRQEYMLGVVRQDDFFIVLLDLQNIFAIKELTALAQQ